MSETTGVSRDVRRRLLVLGLVVVLAVAVVLVWQRDRQRDDEWAHGGDDVSVTAQIQATDRAGYPAALAAAGVEQGLASPGARQSFVIEVDWHGSPASCGSYWFLLLDDRLTPPKPLRTAGAWGADGATGGGWDGRFGALSEHYPWLGRTASRQNEDGTFSDTAEALYLPVGPQGEGQGVLSFFLPDPELTTSRPEDDLVLAMVCTDDDGEVRWARKVPLA